MDKFPFLLIYIYRLPAHRTTELSPFILANARLPLGPAAIAYTMSPDVSEIDAPLTDILRLIHRAPLSENTMDMNTKEAQSRYKKDYDKHGGSESRSAAGGYVFVERLPLKTSAADCTACEGYSSSPPRCKEPYQVISVGPGYSKIDQDGICNTISMRRLTRVTMKAMPKSEVVFHSRTKTDTILVPKMLIKTGKNSYAVDSAVRGKNRATRDYSTF